MYPCVHDLQNNVWEEVSGFVSCSAFFCFPVVYEHRSRLERSLQKERGEHKKTKEGKSLARVAEQWPANPPAVGRCMSGI